MKSRAPTFTQQELISILDYDPDSGIFRWKTRADMRSQWNGRYAGTIAGRRAKRGNIGISIKNKRYQAHRLAWFYVYGEWPLMDIDHRNRVPSDNQIKNLRQATASQNLSNQSIRSDNKTGVRGVTWDKSRGKFFASIRQNGKTIPLGRYQSLAEAKAAYAAASDRLFGEFSPGLADTPIDPGVKNHSPDGHGAG